MTKKVLFNIFISLSWVHAKIYSHRWYNHLWTYGIYNTLVVIFIIGPNVHFSIKQLIYAFLISFIILIFDFYKFGNLFLEYFLSWLFKYGIQTKEKAYKNLILSSQNTPYYEISDILKDQLLFCEQLKNVKGFNIVETEIEEMKEGIIEVESSKITEIKIPGSFLSGRRPLSFLFEHEVALTVATSIILLLLYFLSYLFNSGFINDLLILNPVIIVLSLIYSFIFVSVATTFFRGLSFMLSFDDIFKLTIPDLIQLIDKNKNRDFPVNQIEISKDYYKYYFIYFQLKMIISIISSNVYFIVISILYVTFVNNNSLSTILNFWKYFYIFFFILWIFSFLFLSSILFKSQFHKSLITLLINILVFGVVTFTLYLNFEALFEKIGSSLFSMIGVLWFLCTVLATNTRKLLFDNDNPKILNLYSKPS